jgi:hypothetical protein
MMLQGKQNNSEIKNNKEKNKFNYITNIINQENFIFLINTMMIISTNTLYKYCTIFVPSTIFCTHILNKTRTGQIKIALTLLLMLIAYFAFPCRLTKYLLPSYLSLITCLIICDFLFKKTEHKMIMMYAVDQVIHGWYFKWMANIQCCLENQWIEWLIGGLIFCQIYSLVTSSDYFYSIFRFIIKNSNEEE